VPALPPTASSDPSRLKLASNKITESSTTCKCLLRCSATNEELLLLVDKVALFLEVVSVSNASCQAEVFAALYHGLLELLKSNAFTEAPSTRTASLTEEYADVVRFDDNSTCWTVAATTTAQLASCSCSVELLKSLTLNARAMLACTRTTSCQVGAKLGTMLGSGVGAPECSGVGLDEGSIDGLAEGKADGRAEGSGLGENVCVGSKLGNGVGSLLGNAEGR